MLLQLLSIICVTYYNVYKYVYLYIYILYIMRYVFCYIPAFRLTIAVGFGCRSLFPASTGLKCYSGDARVTGTSQLNLQLDWQFCNQTYVCVVQSHC